MNLENVQKTSNAVEPNNSLSLLSFTPDEIRQSIKGGDSKTAPQVIEFFQTAYSDKAEAEQRRMDDRIQRAFGKDTMEHIKDHKWLASHTDDLKTGFNRIFDGRGEEFTVGQVAARLKELSGGLIFSHSSEGIKSPFSITPADKHFQVYLKGSILSTELFHQVTYDVGTGLDRSIRK